MGASNSCERRAHQIVMISVFTFTRYGGTLLCVSITDESLIQNLANYFFFFCNLFNTGVAVKLYEHIDAFYNIISNQHKSLPCVSFFSSVYLGSQKDCCQGSKGAHMLRVIIREIL